MTARGYPDCDATSPNGRYRLEARSPHNGTIPHRNGQFATDAEYGFAYRDHQSHFRYQLLDTATGNEVVWERWQQSEDSPSELVVSDDGWSILRVCGDRPEVIAVTPTGRDALRVVVADSDQTEQEALLGIVSRGPNARRWCPGTLSFTTAGSFWTGNSWRYFLTALGTRYFVWRSARGARLILDLDAEELVTEDEARAAGLEAHFVERESADALRLLSQFAQNADAIQTALNENYDARKWDQEPLASVWDYYSALVLAVSHRLTAAVPFLRALEPIDSRSGSTRSDAFEGDVDREGRWFRRWVHHALRVLGEEPRGYATYSFSDDGARIDAPECVPNRRERAKQLTRSMSAFDVLQLLGAPDHLSSNSRWVETRHQWAEHWEYDFRTATGWVTLRITWGGGKLLAFTEASADWLESAEREQELLQY